MIRKEFIDIVTNTGMATLKEMRRLSMGKDDEVNEFELLQMPYFDENKFAIKANFEIIEEIPVLTVSSCKLNFYIPNYNRLRKQ